MKKYLWLIFIVTWKLQISHKYVWSDSTVKFQSASEATYFAAELFNNPDVTEIKIQAADK